MRRFVGLVLVGLLSAPLAQAAQVLEEIVVTAQKREQGMQDVGIAVTAFSGEQIKQLGFQNSIDVVTQTPGMTFGTPTAEGNNANLSLRGIALNDFNDNNESPVAVYVDEVYVSAIAGATFQLFDIERVEILRGPQGTLFGRNASGGLAHFISVRPGDEFGGYVDLTLAENSQIKSELAVNVPISDRVAARVSVAQNRFDGYVHNRVPGIDNPNDADSLAGRLQVAVKASDSVNLLFNYHSAEEDSLDGSWQHQSTQQGGAFGDVSVKLPADVTNPSPVVAAPGPGLDAFGYRDTDGDPWAGDYDRDGPLVIENDGFSARLEWDLGPDVTLTSISAWEDYRRLFGEDTDLGPFPGIVPTFDSDIDQFTQEIRLAGSRDRLRWTAGVYYFESQVQGVIDLGVVALAGVAPRCRDGACPPPGTDWLIYYDAKYKQDTDSWAGFGQVEYDLNDAYTLIGGLRYTDERRDLNFLAVDLAGFPVSQGLPDNVYLDFRKTAVGKLTENDSNNVTGKIELDWHPNDDLLVYGSIARGVKAAGFNTGLLDQNGIFNTVAPAQVPVDEEVLTSYEVGIKRSFWDGRARLNASAFYYDYKDFQAFAFANLGQIIFNTDATVNGGELELVLSPTDNFEALFGIGWINEAQAEDIQSPGGRVRDRRMVLAPEFQFNTVLRYTWPIAAGGSIAAQWDGYYQTEQYFDIQNHPVSESDPYAVWNAKLIYNSPDDKWTVTGWVNNVFDEEYLVYTFDFTASFGYNQLGYGRPRWLGVTAAYRW
jgi:iron complex outermembrane receptor protein